MAEKKEIFRSLDDGSEDGVALDQILNATTTLDNTTSGQLSFIAKDAGGSARFLHARDENSAVPTQQIIPSFVAKRGSNNTLQYLQLDDSGALITTSEGTKTPYDIFAEVTVTTSGVEQLVAEVVLGAAGETINDLEILPSSSRDSKWNIYGVDDSGVGDTETLLFSMRSKADHSEPVVLSCLNYDTTGGTDAQGIRIKVIQKSGPGADASAFCCVKAE